MSDFLMKMFKFFAKDEIDELIEIYTKINKISIEEVFFKIKNFLIKYDRLKLTKKTIAKL